MITFRVKKKKRVLQLMLAIFLCSCLALAFFTCKGNHISHLSSLISHLSRPSQFSVLTSHLDYASPVDSSILLAGNFGEPRPWHFHGGIDIKTQNREGWNVRAIADGYVSRLTVNLFGFGNAVYVSHPDGHTSIYCHLQRFADQYEQLFQRTGRRDTLDFHFPAGQLPVSRGDVIALSGNTGYSTGPHLHLEIHDSETWAMRDPMDFLGHLIADTVAPQAHSLMAVPMAGEGLFCGSDQKQTFGIAQPGEKVRRSSLTIRREFTAWGRVGFALWADDYSQTVHNHYGIRHTQLLVDGREVFRSDVDSIPISCQPEVNLWGDYAHWWHHHHWYMKSYREPDMRLPILHTGLDRGIVTFSEERPYQLTYILRDYHGNQAEYHFTVVGRRDSRIPRPRRRLYFSDALPGWQQLLWPLRECYKQ